METSKSTFWFPVKLYGWGWGPPVVWQGWAVLVGYSVLQVVGILHFKAQRDLPGMLTYIGASTIVLLAVIYLKGERPVKWRWGEK